MASPAEGASGFRFIADRHEYWIGDQRLDNVTGILRDAGLVDDTGFTEEARRRGSRVHRACQYLDQGGLDWSSLHPNEVGFVISWQGYKQLAGVEIIEIELPMCDAQLGIAGTLDRVIKDRAGKAILDIKTGWSSPSHAVQLALYRYLYHRYSGEHIVRRQTVLLQADGTPALVVPYSDEIGDEAVARSAITIARWRRQHGLTGRTNGR